MQIPILIEPVESGGFRARAGEPFAASAEGMSAEEAVRALQQQLHDRLREGVQVAVLSVPNGSVGFGPPFPADELYQSDWVFQEIEDAIAENRRLEESASP